MNFKEGVLYFYYDFFIYIYIYIYINVSITFSVNISRYLCIIPIFKKIELGPSLQTNCKTWKHWSYTLCCILNSFVLFFDLQRCFSEMFCIQQRDFVLGQQFF